MTEETLEGLGKDDKEYVREGVQEEKIMVKPKTPDQSTYTKSDLREVMNPAALYFPLSNVK